MVAIKSNIISKQKRETDPELIEKMENLRRKMEKIHKKQKVFLQQKR